MVGSNILMPNYQCEAEITKRWWLIPIRWMACSSIMSSQSTSQQCQHLTVWFFKHFCFYWLLNTIGKLKTMSQTHLDPQYVMYKAVKIVGFWWHGTFKYTVFSIFYSIMIYFYFWVHAKCFGVSAITVTAKWEFNRQWT